MARFIDQYIPESVPGFPCISSPMWSTDLQRVDSGSERANQRWEHPIHRYSLPDAIRLHETYEGIHDHWLAMRGPLYTFPFRDPLDFASVALVRANVEPVISGTDQTIGTGDGVTRMFQLTKTYSRGAQTYTRNIYHPVVSTVLITLNDVDPLSYSPAFTWSVDRNTGIVTFDTPPEPGMIVKAGFYYDVEVRFEDDDAFEGIVRTYQVSGFASIDLIEVRPCE